MARTPDVRVTLDVVAARAGVSKATASKVLNGRPGASPATRERVERALRELGYTPSTRARRVGGSITVVFDTLLSLYSLRVLEGVVGGAQSERVDVATRVLAPGGSAEEGMRFDRDFVRSVAAQGHLGLLAVTTAIDPGLVAECADAGLALVAVDAPNPLDPSVASIGSNHWVGGQQSTEHLVALGHRRIAFVGGDAANPGLRARYGGYREALAAAGLAEDPALVSEHGMASAERIVPGLLALPDPPTAIVATNDLAAFQAVRAVLAAGLRVPEDVSVMGYDDTYADLPTAPLLSTVHTPLHDIGRLAVETLIRMHDGIAPVSHRLELATTLVVRESTAPPPAA
ncbi:substrate-binding domain-containing protein [Rathayibacter sp. ZW T2_19]|uniref:Substrate-binding domain-containing protein n=1 Tax=Rathayibacter rubneri TaxID=2950106 RepID=A0A9X2DY93_9MICO|nr:substrate-binding domain-containing protein [Rathayibacter rubneri]MCM6763117.1 substrate-binding domain-containing protein [Rathayibacter rubneri]